MKTKFALAGLALITGLLTNTACAQSPPRKVRLSGSITQSEFEKQVAAALGARISATTRYMLSNQSEAELEVSLTCLDMSDLTKNVNGGVCSYHFIYWPKQMAGLICKLGSSFITSSSQTSNIGEEIFQELVNASTEKELASNLSAMKEAIAVYEAKKALHL